MRNEIINLLKKENKISEKTVSELKDMDLSDFATVVKELGKEETENIKASEITKDLNTKFIGKNLYVYNEVLSTNTIAKFLSMNDVENGTVIISEKQTQAKGRSGKQWESPLGGVWMSIILNPNVDHSKLPLITLATGVAVAKTLESIGVENPEIKWPNDIMINGKKVCGILTEAVTKLNTIENVIIGVGIDANLNVSDFPEELQEGTTTLKEELKREGNENLLIKIFLEEFEKISELFNHKGYEDIFQIWTSEESARWYDEISKASEDLKDDLKEMFAQRLTPKDFGIKVRDNCMELQITASNKMRTSFDMDLQESFYGNIYETPYISLNVAHNTTNLEQVSWLTNQLHTNGFALEKFKTNTSLIARDVPKEIICEFGTVNI